MIEYEKTRLRVAELNLMTCSVLGYGTSGVVYLAKGILQGTTTEGTYTVKVIEKENKESLEREIETSNMLKKDPIKGVVQVYHAELIDESHGLIIMEYMDIDLIKYLEQNRFIPEYDAKKIIVQLLDGIRGLNQRGYMHRDIKPGNILMKKVGDEWIVKLADFGEARQFVTKSNEDSTFTVIGTYGFAAPDVFSGSYNEKADMWSLGIVMYRMMYGRMPFSSESPIVYKKCLEDYAQRGDKHAIFDQNVKISNECREFIEGLLDTNEKTRWSCTRAAESKFITQSITLWYTVTQPTYTFKRLVLRYNDIGISKSMKDITWRDLVTSVASRIENGDTKCDSAIVVSKEGVWMDLESKVDETGMFAASVEAIIIFDVENIASNIFSFTGLDEENNKWQDLVSTKAVELKKTAKTFEYDMNLGRIKLFLDKLSQLSSSVLGPLLSGAEKCRDCDTALKTVNKAFENTVGEDLNPALARFIQNTQKFTSIGKITLRTFLPLGGNAISLEKFMRDYGADDAIHKAKEVTQKISMLKDEVIKRSRYDSIFLKNKNKIKKEEKGKEEEEGEEKEENVMTEEEIFREAHECERMLGPLFEQVKGPTVMALKWRFGETWNLFISGGYAIKMVRVMINKMEEMGESNNKSDIKSTHDMYERSVSNLLREFEGCVAAPYVPCQEDEIKYLQKDCEKLRKMNEDLKRQLV